MTKRLFFLFLYLFSLQLIADDSSLCPQALRHRSIIHEVNGNVISVNFGGRPRGNGNSVSPVEKPRNTAEIVKLAPEGKGNPELKELLIRWVHDNDVLLLGQGNEVDKSDIVGSIANFVGAQKIDAIPETLKSILPVLRAEQVTIFLQVQEEDPDYLVNGTSLSEYELAYKAQQVNIPVLPMELPIDKLKQAGYKKEYSSPAAKFREAYMARRIAEYSRQNKGKIVVIVDESRLLGIDSFLKFQGLKVGAYKIMSSERSSEISISGPLKSTWMDRFAYLSKSDLKGGRFLDLLFSESYRGYRRAYLQYQKDGLAYQRNQVSDYPPIEYQYHLEYASGGRKSPDEVNP